jgi:hypothetical protein
MCDCELLRCRRPGCADACLLACFRAGGVLGRAALSSRKSVVVDNTNPDAEARKRYIDLAKRHKVAVRCIRVATPRPLAEHLNLVRAIAKTSDNSLVPDIAFDTFYKKLVEPAVEEGFTDVVEWHFCVGPQVSAPQPRVLLRALQLPGRAALTYLLPTHCLWELDRRPSLLTNWLVCFFVVGANG